MSLLRAEYYGVREVRLGGAPMAREMWIERHPEPTHDVKTYTVICDDGTQLAHLLCLTCWTLGIERAAPGEPPAPVETPALADKPAPQDDKTSSTKGTKR